MKGTMCNVPIDAVHVCNSLPRTANSNGIITVKLTGKLQHKCHVYFEIAHPQFTFRLLELLKINNPLCNKIEIDLSNIPNSLTSEGNSGFFD